MSPSPREIELECADVTQRACKHMDDAAEFGVYFNRVEGADLRACAGQLPGFNLEPSDDKKHSH